MPIEKYPFRIIRSPGRKRIALRFAPDGILEVRIPADISDDIAIKAVNDNPDIIAGLKKRTPVKKAPDLSGKSPFMLLGEPYSLRFTHNLRVFDHAFLIPRGSAEEIKKSMIMLYRELANIIIRKRLPEFIRQTGTTPKKIRITDAATRWGSCSSAGTISFSWKLIQCPAPAVDYVIVHELSHLKEMNHSPKFWTLVKKIIPDYRDRKKLLNEFANSLPDWDQKETFTSPETSTGGSIS